MAEASTYPTETAEVHRGRAVTPRCVLAGIGIIILTVLWDEWTAYYMRGSNISRSHFPMALFFPFLSLAVVNMLTRLILPSAALTPSELRVVLGMGLVAAIVPYDGVTGHLIGVLAGVYYFATPENGWDVYLHHHIPTWLAPQNDAGAMNWFYEGTPAGHMPALGAWATPLFWWTCFLGAVAFAIFCLVVMLRRQWVDHERLTYPIVEVGNLLTETEAGGRLSRVFRSPLFWIAFGIVMLMKVWNIGSYFMPAFPPIPFEGGQFRFYPDFPFLIRRVSFYAIGFGYFARLDVLFSVWVWVFLSGFEVFLFNRFGYTPGAADRQWQSPALGWQSGGALIFLAIWSLWMGRQHLVDVWRKATRTGWEGIDDGRELLSYRTAVIGLLVSLAFVVAWLYAAGMDLFVILTFVPISLLTFLGLSRVVAELGLVYVYYQVQPFDAVLQIWGTPTIGGQSVTTLSFMRVFNSAGKGYVMPAMTQSVKAVDGVVKPRQIALMMGVSLVVGYIVSVANTLYLGYAYGAYNLGNMGLKNAAPGALNKAINAIRNPIPMGGKGGLALWAVIGAVAMGGFTLARYWLPWWPLHPIGLAIQGNYGVTKIVFSIVIVWAAKSLLMSIGGVNLYERAKPFFVGLIVAQAVSTALVFALDCVWFPARGHNVHNY